MQKSDREEDELKRVTAFLTHELYENVASLGFAGAQLQGRGLCSVVVDKKCYSAVRTYQETGDFTEDMLSEITYRYVLEGELGEYLSAALESDVNKKYDDLFDRFDVAIKKYNPAFQVVVCYDLDGWDALTGIVVGEGSTLLGDTLVAPADVFIGRAVKRMLNRIELLSTSIVDGESVLSLTGGDKFDLTEDFVRDISEHEPEEESPERIFGKILSDLIDSLDGVKNDEEDQEEDEDSDLGPPPDFVLDAFE